MIPFVDEWVSHQSPGNRSVYLERGCSVSQEVMMFGRTTRRSIPDFCSLGGLSSLEGQPVMAGQFLLSSLSGGLLAWGVMMCDTLTRENIPKVFSLGDFVSLKAQ